VESPHPGAATLIVRCGCGKQLQFPITHLKKPAVCPACHGALRVIAHGTPRSALVRGALVILKGPQRAGERVLLVGEEPIDIGKLHTNDLILAGETVSRLHCRLVPIEGDWLIEDCRSKNGLYVNGRRVESLELHDGDHIRVGGYELRYFAPAASAPPAGPTPPPPPRLSEDSSEHPPIPGSKRARTADEDTEVGFSLEALAEEKGEAVARPRRHVVTQQIAGGEVAFEEEVGELLVCPSCQKELPPGGKICVACGLDVKSGQVLITSDDVDLDRIYIAVEGIIRVISWIIWIGLYPVASEAFGTRKPHVTWGITLTTILISGWYMSYVWTDSPRMRTLKDLMLWSGDGSPSPGLVYYYYNYTSYGDSEAFEENVEKLRAIQPEASRSDVYLAAHQALSPEQQYQGQYRTSQLITHAFLHDGILHLVGNLIFLMVFGSRVNAMVGNVSTVVLYPLLAAGAAMAHVMSMKGQPPTPMIGASGAIMGLAGMYLVFFPVHQVHMAAWARWGLFAGFRLMMKIWSVRGFWVVLFYIAFDVGSTLYGIKDGTAHWAHLGGFGVGIVVAVFLLCTRLVNARGADALSAMLGRGAWVLVGKPRPEPGLIQRLP